MSDQILDYLIQITIFCRNFADNQLRGTIPDLSTLTKLSAV
jgi:hypothetical protein